MKLKEIKNFLFNKNNIQNSKKNIGNYPRFQQVELCYY
jgi:hypothetical protein